MSSSPRSKVSARCATRSRQCNRTPSLLYHLRATLAGARGGSIVERRNRGRRLPEKDDHRVQGSEFIAARGERVSRRRRIVACYMRIEAGSPLWQDQEIEPGG